MSICPEKIGNLCSNIKTIEASFVHDSNKANLYNPEKLVKILNLRPINLSNQLVY